MDPTGELNETLDELTALKSSVKSKVVLNCLSDLEVKVREKLKPSAKVSPIEARKPISVVSNKSESNGKTDVKQNPTFKALKSFAWDQDGYNGKNVFIYITMKGVGKAKERDDSFDLKILDMDGVNYRLIKKPLCKDIIPSKSKFKVKQDRIVVTLRKTEGEYGTDNWTDLIEKTPGLKKKTKDNPTAGIMDMMKKMYDEGDDNMKKTIGEAMMKSRQDRAMNLDWALISTSPQERPQVGSLEIIQMKNTMPSSPDDQDSVKSQESLSFYENLILTNPHSPKQQSFGRNSSVESGLNHFELDAITSKILLPNGTKSEKSIKAPIRLIKNKPNNEESLDNTILPEEIKKMMFKQFTTDQDNKKHKMNSNHFFEKIYKHFKLTGTTLTALDNETLNLKTIEKQKTKLNFARPLLYQNFRLNGILSNVVLDDLDLEIDPEMLSSLGYFSMFSLTPESVYILTNHFVSKTTSISAQNFLWKFLQKSLQQSSLFNPTKYYYLYNGAILLFPYKNQLFNDFFNERMKLKYRIYSNFSQNISLLSIVDTNQFSSTLLDVSLRVDSFQKVLITIAMNQKQVEFVTDKFNTEEIYILIKDKYLVVTDSDMIKQEESKFRIDISDIDIVKNNLFIFNHNHGFKGNIESIDIIYTSPAGNLLHQPTQESSFSLFEKKDNFELLRRGDETEPTLHEWRIRNISEYLCSSLFLFKILYKLKETLCSITLLNLLDLLNIVFIQSYNTYCQDFITHLLDTELFDLLSSLFFLNSDKEDFISSEHIKVLFKSYTTLSLNKHLSRQQTHLLLNKLKRCLLNLLPYANLVEEVFIFAQKTKLFTVTEVFDVFLSLAPQEVVDYQTLSKQSIQYAKDVMLEMTASNIGDQLNDTIQTLSYKKDMSDHQKIYLLSFVSYLLCQLNKNKKLDSYFTPLTKPSIGLFVQYFTNILKINSSPLLLSTLEIFSILLQTKHDHTFHALLRVKLMPYLKEFNWTQSNQACLEEKILTNSLVQTQPELLDLLLECLVLDSTHVDVKAKGAKTFFKLLTLFDKEEKISILLKLDSTYAGFTNKLICLLLSFIDSSTLVIQSMFFDVIFMLYKERLTLLVDMTLKNATKPHHLFETVHHVSKAESALLTIKETQSILFSLLSTFYSAPTNVSVETVVHIIFTLFSKLLTHFKSHNESLSIRIQIVKVGLYFMLQQIRETKEGLSLSQLPSFLSFMENYLEESDTLANVKVPCKSNSFVENRLTNKRLGFFSLSKIVRRKLRRACLGGKVIQLSDKEMTEISNFIKYFERAVDKFNYCDRERERHKLNVKIIILTLQYVTLIKQEQSVVAVFSKLVDYLNFYGTLFAQKGIPERKASSNKIEKQLLHRNGNRHATDEKEDDEIDFSSFSLLRETEVVSSLSGLNTFDKVDIPVADFKSSLDLLNSISTNASSKVGQSQNVSALKTLLNDLNLQVNLIERRSSSHRIQRIPFIDILVLYNQARIVQGCRNVTIGKILSHTTTDQEIQSFVNRFNLLQYSLKYEKRINSSNLKLIENIKAWDDLEKELLIRNSLPSESAERCVQFVSLANTEDQLGRRRLLVKNYRTVKNVKPGRLFRRKRLSSMTNWDLVDDANASVAIPVSDNIYSQFECELHTTCSHDEVLVALSADKLFIFHPFQKLRALVKSDFLSPNNNKLYNFSLSDIKRVEHRRILFIWRAVEITLVSGRHLLISFATKKHLQMFIEGMKEVVSFEDKIGSFQLSTLQKDLYQSRTHNLRKHTRDWLDKTIGNYEYLILLNKLAGRTSQDMNQYFVFPWLLSLSMFNMSKKEIINNLRNQCDETKVLRDLSLPVGALTSDRFKRLLKKKESTDVNSFTLSGIETQPFLYGSHYSNALAIVYYLVRVEPFLTYHKALNDGRLDIKSRLFSSVQQTLNSCLNHDQDFKELIPEFFYQPYFLKRNSESSDLADVKLPNCVENADEFVKLHRILLESDQVSRMLSKWIDLIFGMKQKEPNNLFHPLTYEGNQSIQKCIDSEEKQVIIEQINCFGQTPSQLFFDIHPQRHFAAKRRAKKKINETDSLCSLVVSISRTRAQPLPKLVKFLCNVSNDKVVVLTKDNKRQILSFTKNDANLTSSFFVEQGSFAYCKVGKEKEDILMNWICKNDTIMINTKDKTYSITFNHQVLKKCCIDEVKGEKFFVSTNLGRIYWIDLSKILQQNQSSVGIMQQQSLSFNLGPVQIQRSISTPEVSSTSKFSKPAARQNSFHVSEARVEELEKNFLGLAFEMEAVSLMHYNEEHHLLLLVSKSFKNSKTLILFNTFENRIQGNLKLTDVSDIDRFSFTNSCKIVILSTDKSCYLYDSVGKLLRKFELFDINPDDKVVLFQIIYVQINNIINPILLLLSQEGKLVMIDTDIHRKIKISQVPLIETRVTSARVTNHGETLLVIDERGKLDRYALEYSFLLC